MYQALLILSSLAQIRHVKHGWPHLKRSGELPWKIVQYKFTVYDEGWSTMIQVHCHKICLWERTSVVYNQTKPWCQKLFWMPWSCSRYLYSSGYLTNSPDSCAYPRFELHCLLVRIAKEHKPLHKKNGIKTMLPKYSHETMTSQLNQDNLHHSPVCRALRRCLV